MFINSNLTLTENMVKLAVKDTLELDNLWFDLTLEQLLTFKSIQKIDLYDDHSYKNSIVFDLA